MPLSQALRGVSSTLAGPETYQRPPDSGIAVEQRRLFEATGIHSAVIAPIRSTREVLGALTLGRAETAGDFTPADLPLLEDIARRAGLALDNARLYQRQRKVAETMQNHLLPQMPVVPGLQMTVRYLPAPDASQVGGDWYDAFTLPDAATALAIGDVVGHDLEAAAGMAQLRNMLRAYAWSQQDPPSRIVTRLDEAITPITDVGMATLIFARLTGTDDGRWELSWTNAGHLPPLLVTRDGLAHFLTDGHGILLAPAPACHGPTPRPYCLAVQRFCSTPTAWWRPRPYPRRGPPPAPSARRRSRPPLPGLVHGRTAAPCRAARPRRRRPSGAPHTPVSRREAQARVAVSLSG